MSSQQAAKLGIATGAGVALYAECLRGRVFSPNGLLKLVFDKASERIIGVHICGEDACELIHYGMELVRSRRTITEVSKIMYSAVVSFFLLTLNCIFGGVSTVRFTVVSPVSLHIFVLEKDIS